MKRLIIVMSLILLGNSLPGLASAAVIEITQEEFLTELTACIGSDTSPGTFVRLTDPAIKEVFAEILGDLLRGDVTSAEGRISTLRASGILYRMIQLTGPYSERPILGFLEESPPDCTGYRGWGAVLIRPNGDSRTVHQAPHVKADDFSEVITLDAFVSDLNGRVAMFAGAHRYANCTLMGGTPVLTPACDADGDGFADADVARDTNNNLFHFLTTVLAREGFDNSTPYWFAQLHTSTNRDGPAPAVSDPTIVGSDGAVSRPPHPTLADGSPLVEVDRSLDVGGRLSMGVCGLNEMVTRPDEKGNNVTFDGDYTLCATNNVQGDFLESLGLRQTFMHFEIEASAKDSYRMCRRDPRGCSRTAAAVYSGLRHLLSSMDWYTYEIDQVSNAFTQTSAGCGTPNLGLGSLFQSFTPSVTNLSAIALRVRVGGDFPPTGYTTTIKIRRGAPDGDVLAEAKSRIPGPQDVGKELVVHFFLGRPIRVVPGRPHVIEWRTPEEGDSVLSWMLAQEDSYSGGMAFGCSGDPAPENDFIFVSWTPLNPPPGPRLLGRPIEPPGPRLPGRPPWLSQ